MPGAPILVVGADGFLGGRTARALLAGGCAVHGFGPADPARRLPPGIVGHEGSVLDAAALDRVLAEARPAAVISFAAYGSGGAGLLASAEGDPAQAFAVNVQGLDVLLRACRRAGVPRAVWCSSSTVFGPAAEYPGGVADEDAPPAPRSAYGLSKQLAEAVSLFHRRAGLACCAVRPPLVVGPGRWYGGGAARLHRLVRAAARGERFGEVLPDEGRFDLMHGDDLAELFTLLATHAEPPPALLHATGFTTDWAGIVAALARLRPSFAASVDGSAAAPGLPLLVADRVMTETGFRPRHGLEATLESMLDAAAQDAAEQEEALCPT